MQRQRRRRGISPVKAVAVAIIVVLLIVVAAGMITLGFVSIIPTTTVSTSPPYNSPVSGLTMAGLPTVFNVTPGDAYAFNVTVEATNGSSIPVTLAPANLPAWLSVSLSQASGTTPFNTTVLLNASNTFVGPLSTFDAGPLINGPDYTLPAAHVLFEANISRLGATMAITDVVPIIPCMYPSGFGINSFFYPVSQSTNGGIVNITEIQTNATWSSGLWHVRPSRYFAGNFATMYYYGWQYPLEPLNPYYNETYMNYYVSVNTGAYIAAGNYNVTMYFTFANHAVYIYKTVNQNFYSGI